MASGLVAFLLAFVNISEDNFRDILLPGQLSRYPKLLRVNFDLLALLPHSVSYLVYEMWIFALNCNHLVFFKQLQNRHLLASIGTAPDLVR